MIDLRFGVGSRSVASRLACECASRRACGSRRRAPRSRGTSRSWRSRARAARRRRAGRASAAPARPPRPSSRRRSTRSTRRRTAAAMSSAASPIATTARIRSGSAAIGDRSRPLSRRRRSARRGRRRGSPPTRRAASWPWSRCTSARRRPRRRARCGAAARRTSPSAVGDGVGLGQPGLERRAPTAARALVMSCGQRAGASHATVGDRPAGPVSTRRPRRRRRGSRRRSRPNVTCRPGAAARCAHHDRIVGEADRDVVGALVGEHAAPWPPRSVAIDVCQFRWSGARFSHTAASAAEALASTPGGSCVHSTTNTSSVGVERVDERRRRCCRRRPRAARRRAASRRSAASSSSCRRCR